MPRLSKSQARAVFHPSGHAPRQPDQSNHVARRVLANGTVLRIAGVIGVSGYSGEGLPALSSLLAFPFSVARFNGGYAISGAYGCRISMLWPNATLSTLAGTGDCDLAGDGGPATLAKINPGYGAMATDADGSLVFADALSNAVRRVSPGGVIFRVAGTGAAGYGGDYGPATSALFSYCQGVAPDGNGGLYVAGESSDRSWAQRST